MLGMLRLSLLALVSLAALNAAAADFTVSPIRVDLPRGARSAAVSVANEDARPLRMQLRLMEWTQDEHGKDVHRDSDDLIYYPRLMTLDPGEKRLVRIGIKAPASAAEKTYRLYLDELPRNEAAAVSGVHFTIRFALPVFVAPAQPSLRGAIDSITLKDGKVSVVVGNPGNQTFRIASVGVRAGDFTAESAGWYLLPGATRVHSFDLPPGVCQGLRRLDVAVKAERLSLEGGLDVDAGTCQR
jgi:fimbrial chaperone protein